MNIKSACKLISKFIYINYSHSLKEKENTESIEKNNKNNNEIDDTIKKIRDLMDKNLDLPFSKYPNSWTSKYISRIQNLIIPVRESRSIDLANNLYYATKKIFGSSPDLETAKYSILSLEKNHRIDESSPLREADKNYYLSLLVFFVLICALFFFCHVAFDARLSVDDNVFLGFYGSVLGLVGSIVGWSGRSPKLYDPSSGNRKIDLAWALISAISYPVIPAIIGAISAISILTGVFPLKEGSSKFGFITVVCFAIGFSDSFRSLIMKKIADSKLK